MEQSNIHILCTRPLNEILIQEAAEEGIFIKELPFIQTEPIQSIEVQQEIEQALLQNTTVVFTSMNAVEAVAYYQDETRPEWDIYCIGTTTSKQVAHYFGEESIVGMADDAAALAELIVENGAAEEVIFFCGDQRRDELPGILRKNEIDVNEVTVYQTMELAHKIESIYHGILFFSPSAVESFFKNNTIPASTILFAIGNTTANAVRKFTKNKVITSDAPGKDNLVKKMIEYFAS